MIGGVAGILLTAPLSLQQAIGPRPLLGWVLTLVGAALAVRCCYRSWTPSGRVTSAATIVCIIFAAATASVGVGQVVGAFGTPDSELLCGDDVAPAIIVAGQEVLRGTSPYSEYNVLQAERSLGCPTFHITPLRKGVFASRATAPTDTQDNVAAKAALASHSTTGILMGFNYPAGSALAGVVGARGLVIANALALLAAGVVVTWTARRGLRRWVGLSLAAQTGVLVLVGVAHPDGIAVALLMIACGNRRLFVSGVALGLACATKQTAWFVAAPLLVLAFRDGFRPGLRFAFAAAVSFAAINLPFAVGNPGAWLSGVLAPQASPTFTLGSGPIELFGDGSAVPWLLASATATMMLTVGAGTILAWRGRGGLAEAGVIVASLGLWDGPRSLAYYLAILGVVALSVCARAPALHPARLSENANASAPRLTSQPVPLTSAASP